MSNQQLPSTVLHDGSHLTFRRRDGWEFVTRKHCSGVVVIAAVTDEGQVVLTEQYRIPVSHNVIELPAGLVGDDEDPTETMEIAARRELLEETGFAVEQIVPLVGGPISAGMSSEVITFVRAEGLSKRSAGGGVGDECITVHEVALEDVDVWLRDREAAGCVVDPKVYVGLYFLKSRRA